MITRTQAVSFLRNYAQLNEISNSFYHIFHLESTSIFDEITSEMVDTFLDMMDIKLDNPRYNDIVDLLNNLTTDEPTSYVYDDIVGMKG